MAVFSKLVSLALCLAAGVNAAAVPAVGNTIYYFSFGDSYTTTAFNISGTQPSPSNPMGNPPLGQGTFAGGTNYVGFLTTKYNSSTVLNYNFGFGGATISNSIVPTMGPGIHTFEQQVTQYFSPKYTGANKMWNSDNAIFSIFFGINDIGLPLTTEPSAYEDMSTRIPKLMDKYFDLCHTLYTQGARRFMFIGIPPLDRSPYIAEMGKDKAANYSSWVNAYNGQLATRAGNFSTANPGSVASVYDFHRFMRGVLDDPASLGFPDNNCTNANGQSCIWWDKYHVSSRFDDFLANRMECSWSRLGFNGSQPTGGYCY